MAIALLALGLASPALAQTGVDVSRLPIDLDRIQRGLRESADREERQGLTLRYRVQIYGQAPPIVLFGPDAHLAPHGGRPAAKMAANYRWESGTPLDRRSRPVQSDISSFGFQMQDSSNFQISDSQEVLVNQVCYCPPEEGNNVSRLSTAEIPYGIPDSGH